MIKEAIKYITDLKAEAMEPKVVTIAGKLGTEAGIHAHPHKFRRTLLTDAGTRGVPLQEIQAYAGHAKPDTTMLYVSVKDETVKASFMRLMA